MINNEILSFIKEQAAKGSTKEQLKDILITQGGWDEKDVEEAFEAVNFSGTSFPSVMKNAGAAVFPNEEKKEGKSSGAFAPASELMKAVSSGVEPAVFPPGMSHVEQPKSMEPSAAFASEMARPKEILQNDPYRTTAGFASGGLAGMGARDALGVSAPGSQKAPPAVFQPMTPAVAKPMADISFPGLSNSAPAAYQPPSVVQPVAPFSVVPNTGGFSQAQAPQPLEFPQGGRPPVGFSPALSFNKAPVQPASVSPSPVLMPSLRSMPSVGGPAGVMFNAPGFQTASSLSAMRGQKQKKKGRFLFGLIMFLAGFGIGAVFMNAYLQGFLSGEAMSGLVEKGMNMIGLGTATTQEQSSADDSGS